MAMNRALLNFALVVAAALLASGGASPPRPADASLIAIARAEAKGRGIRLENVRPPRIFDDVDKWVVVLDPPPRNWKGGGVEVSIDKVSGRVVSLERTK